MSPTTAVGIEEKIAELQTLLQADKNLKNLQSDDDYLKRFLYSTNFDVEEAIVKMKLFYETLLEFPEWFPKESPIHYKNVIDRQSRLLSDATDKEGRPIYIVQLGKIQTNVTSLMDYVAVDNIWIESIINEMSIRNGLCVIIDINDIPYSILKWCTPQHVKVIVQRLDSYPISNYIFHVVNNSFFVNVGLNLIWPFLPDHIKEKIKFHFKNRESLYEFIDKNSLPVEYGGEKVLEREEYLNRLYEKSEQIAMNFQAYHTLNVSK